MNSVINGIADSWLTYKAVQRNSLLRHEIAHIQRWDGFYHILQMMAQAIYFFHPLVWLLNARLNEFREMACDDLAIERSHINPLTYSRCLIHVAESMLPKWTLNCRGCRLWTKQYPSSPRNPVIPKGTSSHLSPPTAPLR